MAEDVQLGEQPVAHLTHELATPGRRPRIADFPACTAARDPGRLVAGAARCTITGEDCNSNHGTAAESVEDQTEEGKESLSAKAACEDNRADGVQDRRAGETLYGLLPARNGNIAVSLDGKEVGVDSKNDCSAAEFEGVQCRSNELQRSTAESHCS